MNNNNIITIGVGAFPGLSSVQNMWAGPAYTCSSACSLGRHTFVRACGDGSCVDCVRERRDLRGNRIASIASAAFADMTSLASLYVRVFLVRGPVRR